ncbi:MAG: hypothetical protein QXL51_07870 [Candidatus Aenigmatarchaeota archaeon]
MQGKTRLAKVLKTISAFVFYMCVYIFKKDGKKDKYKEWQERHVHEVAKGV